MKKWGIRLIGAFFLFGAITNYLDIITQRNPPRGFLGITFGYFSGFSPEAMTSQFDLMALIGLCINLYIAYNLLLHRNQGRIWALVVLWLSIITLTVGAALGSFGNQLSPTETFLKFYFFNRSFTLPILAWVGVTLIFYSIQIYFLMRKDVKMEFQRQEISKPKPATE